MNDLSAFVRHLLFLSYVVTFGFLLVSAIIKDAPRFLVLVSFIGINFITLYGLIIGIKNFLAPTLVIIPIIVIIGYAKTPYWMDKKTPD